MSINFFIQRRMNDPIYAWLVWGLAASAFFIEYFARVAPGVMIDSLMRDFNVQASMHTFYQLPELGH